MHTERAIDLPQAWLPHGSRRLSEATALLLERARSAGNPTTRAMLSADVREAIVLFCAQGHADRLPIERLIIELKEGWSALPEVRRLPRGGAHEAMLACIITQCILDFYSDDEFDRPIQRSTRVDRGPLT